MTAGSGKDRGHYPTSAKRGEPKPATSTNKLSVHDFGDRLIQTQDLDPLYVGLNRLALPRSQLCRWLLAYWCFYHVGAASRLSEEEGAEYWLWMGKAAENKMSPKECEIGPTDRWPRAAERRHFRGEKCVRAVWELRRRYRYAEYPAQAVRDLLPRHPHDQCTAKYVMDKVQRWPQFGSWIAFKAADMLDRVYGFRVSFDRDLGLVYKEPRRGLDLLMTTRQEVVCERGAQDHYQSLLTYFARHPEPSRGDRSCGPQEVETVLCKWKSYMGGHYWVGKDIHEHRRELVGWGATAERLRNYYPPEFQGEA